MSTIKESNIKWVVQRLMCECGGEFEHKFNVNYADLPFAHVCNKCDVMEKTDKVYPSTVWEEVKQAS